MVARAALMGKQAAAAGIMLDRAMRKLSADPQNELDSLIFNFMASNADSQDACPAKLLEAKHQLNTLHKHMYAVAYEINTTSSEVRHVTKVIETLTLEWKTEQGECEEEKKKCEEETALYKKQWEILKWELIEMKQIANPSVTITASDMSYAAFKSKESGEESSSSNASRKWNTSSSESSEDSGDGEVPEYAWLGSKPDWWPTLLQLDAEEPTLLQLGARPAPPTLETHTAESVSVLVQNTRAVAKELAHCMAAFSRGGASMADKNYTGFDPNLKGTLPPNRPLAQ